MFNSDQFHFIHFQSKVFHSLTPSAIQAMQRAESVPPDEFIECNTFYLLPGVQLPPLAPQAYFTYAKAESFHQILTDLHNNLGPATELEGVALWIRPPPAPPMPGAALDLDPSPSTAGEPSENSVAADEDYVWVVYDISSLTLIPSNIPLYEYPIKYPIKYFIIMPHYINIPW